MNYLSLLSVLIITVATSCQNIPETPVAELCVGTDQDDLACNDPRLGDDESYFRNLNRGDVCTNPDDYQRWVEHVNWLTEELVKCRNNQ